MTCVKYEVGHCFKNVEYCDCTDIYSYYRVLGYTKSGQMKVLKYHEASYRRDMGANELFHERDCRETYLLKKVDSDRYYCSWYNRAHHISLK